LRRLGSEGGFWAFGACLRKLLSGLGHLRRPQQQEAEVETNGLRVREHARERAEAAERRGRVRLVEAADRRGDARVRIAGCDPGGGRELALG
jgi:hypothetical protein